LLTPPRIHYYGGIPGLLVCVSQNKKTGNPASGDRTVKTILSPKTHRTAARTVSGCVLVGLAAIGSYSEEVAGKAPHKHAATPSLQRRFESASNPTLKTSFRQPPELKIVKDDQRYELCLTTGTFNSPDAAQVDPSIPMSFERLCYNHEPVGPTIRVRRGTAFSICLRNELRGDPDKPSDPVPGVPEGEKPHGLGTTNLHTHGLHVSPDGNSDNIFQSIDPGRSLTFTFELRDDHPSGIFWYHPHKHGSVAYQLSNGLGGALIVEGDPANPNDLESIPEIAAASSWGRQTERENHERIVLLQLFTYRIGTDGVGRIDASQIYNVQPDSNSSDSIVVTGDEPASPPVQVTAINGAINPTFTIAPGEVQRWRIIHAGWDLLRQLVWVDDDDKPTQDIQFNEIAIDGLATGTMTVQSPLQIAPGQRSDALIWADPTATKGKTYHLKQLPVSNALATHNRSTDANYLAKLVVGGDAQSMSLPNMQDPATVKKLAACRPFSAVEDSELSPPSSTDGTAAGTLNFLGSDVIQTYTINGQTFHQLKPVELTIGRSEEWTLNALLGSHPFHIHVNPFQVVSYTDPSGVTSPMDVWRDTLYIPQGASYTIRSRFRDFIGDTVLHCHILDHEDQGMMMCLRFKDPTKRRAAQGPGCPEQLLARCEVPAPPFVARDVFGGQYDMRTGNGRPTVVVFFRGMGCPHCTQQLRDLLKAHASIGFDVDIVAASGEAVPDADQAMAELGKPQLEYFHLFADSDHKLFRAFGGRKSEGVTHGLFLMDRNGVVRAFYTGDSPFRDTQEVVQRLGRLDDLKTGPIAANASR
jgi:FtsP/CotA-like multicopper oxidase with cupredoxin domain/peroxiredoxin